MDWVALIQLLGGGTTGGLVVFMLLRRSFEDRLRAETEKIRAQTGSESSSGFAGAAQSLVGTSQEVANMWREIAKSIGVNLKDLEERLQVETLARIKIEADLRSALARIDALEAVLVRAGIDPATV